MKGIKRWKNAIVLFVPRGPDWNRGDRFYGDGRS